MGTSPSPDSRRVRRPGALWIVASTIVLVLSLIGGAALASTVDKVNQDRLDLSVDGLESSLSDQLMGYRIIALVLPVVMAPEGGGVTLDAIEALMVSDGDRTAPMAAMIGAFPLDGFAAMAFGTIGADGGVTPLMLPNLRDLSGDVLFAPAIASVIDLAVTTQRPATSAPLQIGGETMYVFAVPVTEALVAVELVVPEELLGGNAISAGEQHLDVTAIDVESGTTVVELRSTDTRRAERTVEVSFLGRPMLLEVSPGVAFDWQAGWMAGVGAAAMGALIALLIYVVGVVSRRRLMEEQERVRLARQVNEDKDRFIAAVSHELRTPLTAVVGLAEVLATTPGTVDSDQLHELTAIMAHESNEMALLVEDLLVAARTQEGTVVVRPEPVDVDEHVARVCSGLSEGASSVTAVPSGCMVWADPLRLRQIVRNLVINSMRHGGPNIEVSAQCGDQVTAIEVRDDGPGIHGEARRRMFEPYYRSAVVPGQAPSVGLGLSVAHGLAEAMDGELAYRFEEGRSVFRLTLPAVLVGTPSRPTRPDPDESPQRA